MALTPQIKTAIDGLDNIDRALVMLYIFGVDDMALAATIGSAFIDRFYPNVENPTNDQKALAILLQTRLHVKNTYVSYIAQAAANAAQAAAESEIPYGDIGELSQPPVL